VGDWTGWQVLAGLAGVLGVSAFVAAYFSGVLNALWPSPARIAGLMRQRDLPLPAGERFVILIADLQGDDEKRTHTRHVAAALEPYRGLDVIAVGPGPEWGVEGRDAFEAKARALLAKRHGDVLISGDVTSAGKGVRLRILPSDQSVAVQHGAADGRRAGEYVLTDTGLPLDFDRDFEAMLVAFVAASVAPATEPQGHYLVDLLEPAAARLNNLCAKIPAGLSQDQRGILRHALGLAANVLGEQMGDNDWLERAVAAYREALKERTRARAAGRGGRGLPRGPQGKDPSARPARLGADPEQPGQRAGDAWGAGERHGAAGRGGRGLPRGPQGEDPRARPARLGADPEQPGQRAGEAWGAGERHGAAGRGGRGPPRGP
jgi:hypothetical protein